MDNAVYAIFDKMIEGVQIINRAWQYVYVNDALLEYSLFKREELLGTTMMERYPGIENTSMFNYLRNCMEQGTPHTMVNEFTFPDGSTGYFELRIQSVPDGVMILSIDITEKQRMELLLLELNDNLERKIIERTSQLVDSLEREKQMNELSSSLISLASHEFRTPLSAILSSAALAERYAEPEHKEQRQRHLAKIKAAVVHLTAILNDFLSLEKLENGRMEYQVDSIDVQAFIQEVVEDAQLIAATGQYIHYKHSSRVSNASVDKNILRNIIFNLLSNALKYSPDSSDVEFETKLSSKELLMTVKDKGIGIPHKEKKNLFRKFFRASNVHTIPGTGLGLAIVKQYVDLAKGSISFRSRLNKGTTVTVIIPRTP